MKISELEDRLENVTNNLMTVYETINAIGASLDAGGVKAENLTYAIGGVQKCVYETVSEVEGLVVEVIKVKNILQEL